MKIADAWGAVEDRSSKASVLTQLIGGALVILGAVMQLSYYVQFGFAIVALNLLQYTVQTIILNHCVRQSELKGMVGTLFPSWVPQIGYIFFYAKILVALAAMFFISMWGC